MTRWVVLGATLVLAASVGGQAQAQSRIVDIAEYGGLAVAVTQGGDIFTSSEDYDPPCAQSPWTLQRNVFGCGAPSGTDVVGLILGVNNFVLMSDGTLMSVHGCTVGQNIFAVAGRHSAGQRFVAVGQTTPGYLALRPFYFAATDGGDIYRYGGGTSWQYVGNIQGNLPVPTELKTWGRVKAERR